MQACMCRNTTCMHATPPQATQDVLAAHKACATEGVQAAAPTLAGRMRGGAAAVITALEHVRNG